MLVSADHAAGELFSASQTSPTPLSGTQVEKSVSGIAISGIATSGIATVGKEAM